MVKRIIQFIRHVLFRIKQDCYCKFFHKRHRCYPEVNKPDSNLWHCAKCHPCGEFFDIMFKKMGKEKVKEAKEKVKEAKEKVKEAKAKAKAEIKEAKRDNRR